MKHEQSAPAGYRPRFAGTMKLYLVRHKEYGELTVNGVNKYEAVHAAARAWGVRWTAIARECEYIVLAEDTPEAGIGVLGTILGGVLSYAAFHRNSKKDSEEEGKSSGTMLTEIGYIKGGIDRIERKQDAQDARYISMAERMSAVESSPYSL